MKEKVTFYLKEPNATKETLILAFFHFHNTRVKLSTEVRAHPKTWNPRKYRLKSSALHATLINERLDRIAEALSTIYLNLLNENRPITPEEIKARYVSIMRQRALANGKGGFFDCYEAYIEASKDKLQHGSLQVHRTAINHLKAFEKAYGVTVTFSRVDLLFFEKFVGYLVRVVQLNNVTTWKMIKTIRAFLRWALDQKLTDNTEFQRFTRKKLPSGDTSEKVYLTLEEVQHLMKMDLSANPKLDRTRDLFIFQAHTGMRYGDVFRFKSELVQGDSIRLVTSKNRKAVAIPLLPAAKTVLEKYNGNLPKVSNQKQNVYLKELMEKAGIDSSVVVVDYRGIERIEKTMPKYELIGTHSAKRTFVTILRQRGVSIEAIMRITGNSRRTIETYILATEEDVAREVESAWA